MTRSLFAARVLRPGFLIQLRPELRRLEREIDEKKTGEIMQVFVFFALRHIEILASNSVRDNHEFVTFYLREPRCVCVCARTGDS